MSGINVSHLSIPTVRTRGDKCGANSSDDGTLGYICTRRDGHGGRHLACGGAFAIYSWPSPSPAPPAPTRSGTPAEVDGQSSGPKPISGGSVGGAS